MKTPVERLFEYIKEKYPEAMPSEAEQNRLLKSEMIQQHVAYQFFEVVRQLQQA